MRILCGVVWLCLATSALAAEPPAPKWGEVDQAVGQEKYADAKKLADAILQRGTPDDRVKTMQVYGRILLGLGQKEEARQYLRTITGGRKGRGVATGLPVIYAAWLKAYDKPEEAIKTLEKMLEQSGSAPDETAAEAADVLAMLYMARGEQDKAKKAVDFGLKTLQYRGKKDGYVLTLLQNRLNSDIAAGQAKRLYNEAEKLRSQNKFAEAGQLFAQIRAMYPKNPWAHASGFRIGQCFLGLNQSVKAADWWQKFIKESPTGSWRGQAYVGLIDVSLETQLDLKRATELVMAASATLAKATEPTWKEAAYDIHLRQGIVSLADGRFDAAVQGFRDAKPSAPGDVQAGLDRLTEAALNRAKLVPDELCVGDDRATTALVLGNIYNVLHQYDAAKRWFSLLLNGSLRSHSAAHRSFAGLGLARAVIASDKSLPGSKVNPLTQAKTIYEASLQEFPKASWHDETLYRLATIIQDQANATFANSSKPAANGKNTQQVRPNTLQTDLKAERERRIAWVKAKGEALPYWQDIIKRYPQSPLCEQAFYCAGVLQYEMADAEPATTSDQRWKDADAMFKQLCERYPQSPYACDAYVRQIDFALERKFDMKLATSLVDRGIQWAKDQKVTVSTAANGSLTQQSIEDAARTIQNASAKLPEWSQPGTKPPADLLNDLYNLYLRAGILAYLQEKYDEAILYFDKAGPVRPTDGMQATFDRQKFGLHILKVCSVRKTPAWRPDAIDAAKKDSQKLALKLADTYLHSQRPKKADAIYKQLLAGNSLFGYPSKAVESYCVMRLAQAYSRDNANRDKSIEYYSRFYKNDYAEFPWAADAIIRLAVLEHNTTRDPRRTISHYQYILKKYPNHPDAERAMYFLTLDALQLGDKKFAEASCKQFVEKYPRSEWKKHVETVLTNEVPKLQDKEGKQQ